MGRSEEQIQEAPIWRRMAWGAAALTKVFAPFTAVILLMLLLGGPEIERRGVSLRVDLLFLLYPTGAAATGALIGALWPFTRSRVGAMLVGAVAMLPWAAACSLTIERGYADWTGAHTFTTAVTSLLGAAPGWGMAAGGPKKQVWRQRKQRVTSRVHPPAV